jgi:hypothetical protein
MGPAVRRSAEELIHVWLAQTSRPSFRSRSLSNRERYGLKWPAAIDLHVPLNSLLLANTDVGRDEKTSHNTILECPERTKTNKSLQRMQFMHASNGVLVLPAQALTNRRPL